MLPFIVRTRPVAWCCAVIRSSISDGSLRNSSTRANIASSSSGVTLAPSPSLTPSKRTVESVAGELVREQGERERAPGELRIGAERAERVRDAREPLRLAGEALERGRERVPPLGGVELRREARGGDGLVVELAVRISAGGQHEEGAAPGGVQRRLVD